MCRARLDDKIRITWMKFEIVSTELHSAEFKFYNATAATAAHHTAPVVMDRWHCAQQILRWYIVFVTVILVDAMISLLQGIYDKRPYHTSALSGVAWVQELLTGHPDRIRCELGVSVNVFWVIINELCSLGHSDLKHVALEEQLAIFLFTCVTGNTSRHIGEHFQQSTDTITWYILWHSSRVPLTFSL